MLYATEEPQSNPVVLLQNNNNEVLCQAVLEFKS